MSENTKKEYKTYDVKPYTKEEREKILQDIDNKLLEFINSDKYKDVLLMMGNLGNYSLTNQIYILLQNENATSVAGMKEWNYKGRSVIPGEKAIKIFAPIKGKDEVLLVDEDGNPLLDEEGNQRKREVERIKGFKPAFVFDITQTTGKELQAFKFDENSTVEEKDLIIKGLTDVVGKKGYTFRYATEEELGKGCEGMCKYDTKEILVKEGMSDLQTVSVLVHECGHALAHGPYRESFEGLKELPSRDIREVEAESIACVVCSHLGLNTDNYNFSYISGWAQGDISKFRKNMDRIGMFSGDLIEGIDNAFTQDRVAKFKKEKELQESSNEVVTEVPPSSGKKRGRPKKQVEAEAC